jgi:hypothetical protein
MPKDAYDLFCPTCNIMVEAKVIARGSGGFSRIAGAKQTSLNARGLVDVHARCDRDSGYE